MAQVAPPPAETRLPPAGDPGHALWPLGDARALFAPRAQPVRRPQRRPSPVPAPAGAAAEAPPAPSGRGRGRGQAGGGRGSASRGRGAPALPPGVSAPQRQPTPPPAHASPPAEQNGPPEKEAPSPRPRREQPRVVHFAPTLGEVVYNPTDEGVQWGPAPAADGTAGHPWEVEDGDSEEGEKGGRAGAAVAYIDQWRERMAARWLAGDRVQVIADPTASRSPEAQQAARLQGSVGLVVSIDGPFVTLQLDKQQQQQSGEGEAERRVDPADGKSYTRAEFAACYSAPGEADRRWDAAAAHAALAGPARLCRVPGSALAPPSLNSPVERTVILRRLTTTEKIGWLRNKDLIVGRVEPASPAGRAGVRAGEQIIAVGDHPVSTPAELGAALQQQPPAFPVTLRVAPSAAAATAAATPAGPQEGAALARKPRAGDRVALSPHTQEMGCLRRGEAGDLIKEHWKPGTGSGTVWPFQVRGPRGDLAWYREHALIPLDSQGGAPAAADAAQPAAAAAPAVDPVDEWAEVWTSTEPKAMARPLPGASERARVPAAAAVVACAAAGVLAAADGLRHRLGGELADWKALFLVRTGRAPAKRDVLEDATFAPLYRRWAAAVALCGPRTGAAQPARPSPAEAAAEGGGAGAGGEAGGKGGGMEAMQAHLARLAAGAAAREGQDEGSDEGGGDQRSGEGGGEDGAGGDGLAAEMRAHLERLAGTAPAGSKRPAGAAVGGAPPPKRAVNVKTQA
eukprot:TRINITY_DN10227_c1_g1_i1.p1 TRINITY_DN10227_c1_g1~~TRINITY_DN10227_c1_g1_i1.p1  ORF type:complete len:759 (+),score=188.96 TRINITY_DN10227_c1_g1_i1:60-2279(+)